MIEEEKTSVAGDEESTKEKETPYTLCKGCSKPGKLKVEVKLSRMAHSFRKEKGVCKINIKCPTCGRRVYVLLDGSALLLMNRIEHDCLIRANIKEAWNHHNDKDPLSFDALVDGVNRMCELRE